MSVYGTGICSSGDIVASRTVLNLVQDRSSAYHCASSGFITKILQKIKRAS